MVPWIELRGSIPLGLAWHLPWPLVFVVTVAVNALMFIPAFLMLHVFYDHWFSHIPVVQRWVEGVRRRGQASIDRYGVLGLAIFVAVPLPGTGAYSGTLLAFLMNLPFTKAFLAVGLGVVGAGVLVMLAATGVLAGLRFLV